VRWLVAFALSVTGSALAQEAWLFPDPIAWYRRTNDVITGYGLHTQVETLGYALVFTLFAYGAARAAYFARSAEFGALFGRLLLVAALLLSLTPIRSALHGTWVAAFGWSSSMFEGVQDELLSSADDIALLLAPFFAAGASVTYLGRRVATRSAAAALQSGGRTSASLAGRAAGYMNGVLLLFFPLFGMYAALVYASGLVVLLSMLLLPLAGALLLLPNGASWMSRWLGMYAGSLFTVLFLPIVFGIAVDLGMAQPMRTMSTHMDEALVAFGAAAEMMAVPTGPDAWNPAQWQSWLESVPDSLLSAFGGIVSILLGWLLSLIALIVGMLVGVYLLMNLPGLMGGFIGGIGASAASAFSLARPGGGTGIRSLGAARSPPARPASGSQTLPTPKPGGSRTP
jgi:hypothetical protein